jgi:glycyl-tRNA synthetase
MVGLDAQILMHPKTWEASGHVGGFNDPLIDDKNTGERFRADKLIEARISSDLNMTTEKLKEKVAVMFEFFEDLEQEIEKFEFDIDMNKTYEELIIEIDD